MAYGSPERVADVPAYYADIRGGRPVRPELLTDLTERYRRLDKDLVRYEVTVEDPKTWTRPWTAALDMKRQPGGMFEYACHEGNYALRNILTGSRMADKR